MKSFLLFIILFTIFHLGHSQCSTGILITNCGGCQSGCDLTSFGGPTCASLGNPTGNCSSIQNLTEDISVPAGCSFTVNATIEPRPGCNSGSGADGSDQIKVDLLSGSKSFISGASNSSISDSYTLNGPGTIRISSRVNRRDEITTYTIASSGINGSSCPSCFSSLPIELISFDAEIENRTVALHWSTNVEINNDYFTIEKSYNGIDFEFFDYVNGNGNSTIKSYYKLYDSNPFTGISYYRLKQTDFDGTTTIIGIDVVNLNTDSEFELFPNPARSSFYVADKRIANADFVVYNSIGQSTNVPFLKSNNLVQFDTSNLAPGQYILKVILLNELITKKIIIN